MKASDIKLDEIISFNEGQLDIHGRRLVIHDMRAFAQFRKDLIDMIGLDQARRILTRFGNFWGQADASAMKRIFEWDNIEELIIAGTRIHTLQGVAKILVKSLSIENDKFFMEIILNDSGEAMEHISELGYSDIPICWILIGYISGYCSYCLNKTVYFIESQCVGKKDLNCSAVGKDVDSWDDEINPYLTYFQVDDIKGKIINLAKLVEEKNLQLKKQQKIIKDMEKPKKPFLEEIQSKSFQQVLNISNRSAKFDTSILITGETGVGKEVITKYIHRISNRSNGPFLAINCGALPETLAESELFGHKAGSFTGAIKDEIGLFEQAKGGTLLLDEIGDISLNLQLKILRVLQEREIVRVGENMPRKIDVRIIAATNKNLEDLIGKKIFRQDLYYRLKVIEIEIPPLRKRKEDILTLARYFINHFSLRYKLPKLKLHASCIKYLENYSWPGNIRELENVIERAIVLSDNNIILPEHLPEEVFNDDIVNNNYYNKNQTLNDFELIYIKKVLDSVNGNKKKASKILGIGQSTLWRKLKYSE